MYTFDMLDGTVDGKYSALDLLLKLSNQGMTTQRVDASVSSYVKHNHYTSSSNVGKSRQLEA